MAKLLFPDAKPTAWMIRSLFAMLGIICLLLASMAWVIYQPVAISYPDLPFKITGYTKVFYPAQTVPVKVEICNRLSTPVVYQVTRSIKNIETGQIYDFQSSSKAIAIPGCSSSISMRHLLPSTLELGTYQITGFSTVKGPLDNIDVPFYSEPFIVKAIPTTLELIE